MPMNNLSWKLLQKGRVTVVENYPGLFKRSLGFALAHELPNQIFILASGFHVLDS